MNEKPIIITGNNYFPPEKLTESLVAEVIGGLVIPNPKLSRTLAREVRSLREKLEEKNPKIILDK